MEKLQFSVLIKAPCQKVWEILWNDETYRKWVSAFMEGSYAETDWKEGSKIKFLTPNGDGMHSIIEKKEEPRLMVFKHMGEIKAFKEVEPDQKVKNWMGVLETYTLTEVNGSTRLEAEMETNEDYADYFRRTFPVALEKVKLMAEE